MRRLGYLLSIIVLLFVTTACSNSGDTSTSKENSNGKNKDEKIVIGTSVASLGFLFFVEGQKAAEEAANELGIKTIFYDAEENQAKQNQDIEDMIVKGVDAIVVAPVTTEGIVPAIKQANEKGIPVFTVDRYVESDEVDIVAHLGTDNIDMGANAAELFVKGLEDKYPNEKVFKVAELIGTAGSSTAMERGEGIHSVLENHPKIEFVANLNADFQSTEAMSTTEDILTSNKELHGIIAHNDMMIEGAFRAADAAGRAKDLILVGMDGQKSTVEQIIAGDIYGSYLQQAAMLGDGVRAAVEFLDGKEIEEIIAIPTEEINPENAEEMINKAW